METFKIEIITNGKWVSFDFSPNIPCMLADEIKELVKNFYKEDK